MVERKLAISVEKRSAFSIVENRVIPAIILCKEPHLDVLYRKTAMVIISLACIILVDESAVPFMGPHMDICHEYGFHHIDQNRNVHAGVDILCSLGLGYVSRQRPDIADEVWTKADMQCWIAKIQIALLNIICHPIPDYLEQADFLMWSALKHGTQEDQRLIEYSLQSSVIRGIQRLKGILNGTVSLGDYDIELADSDESSSVTEGERIDSDSDSENQSLPQSGKRIAEPIQTDRLDGGSGLCD